MTGTWNVGACSVGAVYLWSGMVLLDRRAGCRADSQDRTEQENAFRFKEQGGRKALMKEGSGREKGMECAMGKIVLLVSREEMLYQAHNILQEKKFPIAEMKVIQTEQAVAEARQARGNGATIVIARGLQASMIKQYTDIPVVEIVLTAQEMALLVRRAGQIVKKPKPVIAVVGFRNMFSDMSYFDELYDIELRTYFATQGAELSQMAGQAVADGADLIIGGDTAVAVASKAQIPSLFLSTTEESLRNAFSMAESMEYAMDVERRTAAQLETLLDYSYNGVVHLDGAGRVTAMNLLAEELLGKTLEEMRGSSLLETVKELKEAELLQVLSEGREYSFFLERNGSSMFAVLAPVLYEGKPDGAILTCRRMKRQKRETAAGLGQGNRKEEKTAARALPPLIRFDDIMQNSPAMRECIRLAKLYALSEQPVVIVGETGTEKRMLAESIHNGGIHRSGPFVEASCEGLTEEEQRRLLFGDMGMAMQARGGTLVLSDIQALTGANQYRLHHLIRYHICQEPGGEKLQKLNLRLMVILSQPLIKLLEAGILRQDLFYLLSGLELRIPPLRDRREDLEQKLSDTLKECCERYSRYHVLTEGAKEMLRAYDWPGNHLQIESFFERLILTAEHRSMDEQAVRRLLLGLYPEKRDKGEMENGPGERTGVLEASDRKREAGSLLQSAEAGQIAEALTACGGNRKKTAELLGVSKATLWRKMKKYEME